MIWLLTVALAAGPTLDEVLASVDAHAPLLLAADADVQAAEGRLRQAKGAFDPFLYMDFENRSGPYDYNLGQARVQQRTGLWGLSIDGGYRIGTGNIPVYYQNDKTLQGGEVGVKLRLPTLAGGPTDAARTAVRVSEAGLAEAEARFLRQRVRLGREARIAWARWLAAGARLRLNLELLRAAEDAEDLVQKRVQRGDLPPLDRLDQQRVRLERAAVVEAARRDLAVAAALLGLFLRDSSGQPAPPPDDLIPPSFPAATADAMRPEADIVDQALNDRPEIESLRQIQAQIGARLRLARTELLPRLDLLVGVSQDLPASGDTTEPVDLSVGAAFGFAIPRRTAFGRVDSEQAARVRVNAELDWFVDQVRAEVASALAALRAALARVRITQEDAELAEELVAVTRRRYELGDVNLFEIYLREQTALAARLRYIDAQLEVLVAQADLNAAVGAP